MKLRQQAQRLVLKAALRKKLRSLPFNSEEAKAIRTVLADQDHLDAVLEFTHAELRPLGNDGSFLDSFREFFEFLIENQDEIVSFIKILIALFSESK
jgi:hypothetical protein